MQSSAKENKNNQHEDPTVKHVWKEIKVRVNEQIRVNYTSETKLEDIDENDLDRSTPTMVFSVIGDSDNLVPRPWPKTVFQTALIEAAKSGGETWILYRGKEQGLSKVVREAYKNYEEMEFKTKLEDKKINNEDRHIKLIKIAGLKTNESLRDDANTPLTVEKVLLKNDYKTTEGEGDTFLLNFEKFVSEQKVAFFSQKMDAKMPVPIAIIVCEGDLDTINHISNALGKKLPVIIMKGSGMAADLVCERLQNSDLELKKKASILFGIRFDDDMYETLKEQLDKIYEGRDLIGIFDLDQDDPLKLSNIVGEAVVSCWSTEDLKTDVLHNQPSERAVKPVKNDNSDKKKSLAWRLLRPNSTSATFITPLLEEFKESRPYILNPKYSAPTSLPLYFFFGYQYLQESSNLMEECGPTVSCQNCKFKKDCLHMQWILRQIKEQEARNVCHTYKCLLKKKKKKKLKDDDEMIFNGLPTSVASAAKKLCRCILRYKESDQTQQNQIKPNSAEEIPVYTESNNKSPKYLSISDLLLWAIFANRKELAEICWLRGTDHLLTGLVCAAVLGKLSKKAGNVKEQVLSNDLEKHSKLFEQRCLRMMDSMYEEDTKQAIKLMDDEANVWGINSSPLTFAYENVMYDVVAHTCSQKFMNKQWYNKLAPDLVPFLKSAIHKRKKFLSAPLTKYVVNYMLFFSMLVMYSAFVLTSVDTEYYVQDIAKIYEYYVYFWGVGDLIEELISCFGCLEAHGRSHRSNYSRIKRYLYDFWNLVDLLSYALLVSALFVRHFYIDENFVIARRMFALSLLVMYLRFLEVFLIHRTLGPTLIMIKEMLKDLLSFLILAVFVVLGVGIYYHANLWPDHQTIWNGDWTDWRIWKIIYYPYWQLYGELNLETLEGTGPKNCTLVKSEWEADSSVERCPDQDWTVLAVAAIYLLFSNLLLVNLVIAMFSYTFERVQENSEKLWRFQRYTVINDYDWRIPSPLNIAFLPYRLLCCPTRTDCCLHWCKKQCNKKNHDEKMKKREKKLIFRRNFQKIIAFRNHNKV
nr:transient receptor potential cation channel subfamily M member-like 2 isoform X2 [Crassostrea gigas]